MLAARKKKCQSARRMSRSTASASAFLIISQPCEYSSVSTRKDWGRVVPTFIMIAPAFMVPDNRLSPYVEDLAANEKNASRACEVIEIPGGIRYPPGRCRSADHVVLGRQLHRWLPIP